MRELIASSVGVRKQHQTLWSWLGLALAGVLRDSGICVRLQVQADPAGPVEVRAVDGVLGCGRIVVEGVLYGVGD